MALKKKKEKDNVTFIDPVTMEARCTYNDCYEKFVEATRHKIRTPEWRDYTPVKFLHHFHECPDCGMTYTSKEDKNKNFHSYSRAKFGNHKLTAKEMREVIDTMKRIVETTTDRDKRNKAATVYNDYLKRLKQKIKDKQKEES